MDKNKLEKSRLKQRKTGGRKAAGRGKSNKPIINQEELEKRRKKVDVNRNQERSKPNIIIEAGVAEGPAKQNTTIKTFKFPLQKEVLVNKDNMIKTVPAKIGQFDKGGKVKLALRGGGRAYNKNS